MLDPDREAAPSHFSLKPSLLRDVLRHARPLGHNEDAETLNLGFGFLYYGLVRSLRPRHVLVIGSGFGFSVTCLGLGLKDNGAGRLTFVDPSFSVLKDGPLQTFGGTSQWDDPEQVSARFARFGIDGIVTHHKLTSGDFFQRYGLLKLPPIDFAFVDGNHAYEHVRRDFVNVLKTRKSDPHHVYVAISSTVEDGTLVHQLAHVLDYLAGSRLMPGLSKPLSFDLGIPVEHLEHPREFGHWLAFLQEKFHVEPDADDAIIGYLYGRGLLIEGEHIRNQDAVILKTKSERILKFMSENSAEIDAVICERKGYIGSRTRKDH